MLKATGLTVDGSPKPREGAHPLLQHINLCLVKGQVTVIVGPNGAGKSTLLKALGGLTPLAGGQVELEIQGQYQVISSSSGKVGTPALRQAAWESLSWYGNPGSIPFGFTVYDIVMMGRFPRHRGWPTQKDHRRVQEILQLFGLHTMALRSVLTLSSGEFQKTMLARVFSSDSPVMLLDEPTSHLDPSAVFFLGRLLKKTAQQGAAIGVVLHDLSQAYRWADRIILLNKGKVVAEGVPEDSHVTKGIAEIFELSFGKIQSPQGESIVYFYDTGHSGVES